MSLFIYLFSFFKHLELGTDEVEMMELLKYFICA